MRVNIESSTTAKVTCSALTYHGHPNKGFDPGSNKFISGGLYLCDVVKIGELWKISSWKAKTVWVDGDPAVMAVKHREARHLNTAPPTTS
ncbi:putative SnoaL-like domain-containing protein [Seiridium unicorne]|uniref:SnoaL-like domain-containing protein n=1 Tax=Seiridium unicorne TaxID=138068 RepID=A0ABR2UFA4_9PEZI